MGYARKDIEETKKIAKKSFWRRWGCFVRNARESIL